MEPGRSTSQWWSWRSPKTDQGPRPGGIPKGVPKNVPKGVPIGVPWFFAVRTFDYSPAGRFGKSFLPAAGSIFGG
jgi:hypothetical protein